MRSPRCVGLTHLVHPFCTCLSSSIKGFTKETLSKTEIWPGYHQTLAKFGGNYPKISGFGSFLGYWRYPNPSDPVSGVQAPFGSKNSPKMVKTLKINVLEHFLGDSEGCTPQGSIQNHGYRPNIFGMVLLHSLIPIPHRKLPIWW